MTEPTSIVPPTETPPADAEAQPVLTLRRTLRTASSEAWELADGEQQRVGAVSIQYTGDAVEGVLAVPPGLDADGVRGLLAWVTEMLTLDLSAGPGGLIHWVVVTGELEDFWRRSPGRRASGAETDLATTRARVEPVLAAMFTEYSTLDNGAFAVDTGSARVFVEVRLVDTSPVVRVFAITNLDVPLDGGLPAHLLALNFSMAFGRFSLDTEHRAVWCDHVLASDDLDDSSLARAITAVASTADRHDDEIKARFGGRTFREEGSPVEQVGAGPGMLGGYL